MAALAALHALLGESEGEGPSSDMQAFREVFAKARNILVLSGAGMSAESGVPTFRLEQIILFQPRYSSPLNTKAVSFSMISNSCWRGLVTCV